MLASYRLTNDITKLMVSHHPQQGHPPSQGWSPTIQNLPKGSVQQTWNLAPRLISQNQDKMTSAMDGQPPSQGWSTTNPWMVTHHLKPTRRKCTTDLEFGTKTYLTKFKQRLQLPQMVSNHPLDGHPPSQGHPLTIQNIQSLALIWYTQLVPSPNWTLKLSFSLFRSVFLLHRDLFSQKVCSIKNLFCGS